MGLSKAMGGGWFASVLERVCDSAFLLLLSEGLLLNFALRFFLRVS